MYQQWPSTVIHRPASRRSPHLSRTTSSSLLSCPCRGVREEQEQVCWLTPRACVRPARGASFPADILYSSHDHSTLRRPLPALRTSGAFSISSLMVPSALDVPATRAARATGSHGTLCAVLHAEIHLAVADGPGHPPVFRAASSYAARLVRACRLPVRCDPRVRAADALPHDVNTAAAADTGGHAMQICASSS